MKRSIILVLMLIFSLTCLTASAIEENSKSDSKASAPSDRETLVNDQEASPVTAPVAEINDVDKNNLAGSESLNLQANANKANVQKESVYIITGTTLFFLVLILLML